MICPICKQTSIVSAHFTTCATYTCQSDHGPYYINGNNHSHYYRVEYDYASSHNTDKYFSIIIIDPFYIECTNSRTEIYELKFDPILIKHDLQYKLVHLDYSILDNNNFDILKEKLEKYKLLL